MNENEHLIEQNIQDYTKYSDLPMSVMIINSAGDIIKRNRNAEQLLNLKEKDLNINISEFYVDIRERRRLLDEFKKLKNQEWSKNESVLFKINHKFKSISFFSRVTKDAKNNIVGLLCLIFEITEFERFKNLESQIPAGFFQISSDQEVIYLNDEFARILGYKPNEIKLPCAATKFFQKSKDFYNIVEQLERCKTRVLELTEVKLKRKDNTTILTNVYLVPKFDSRKKLIGSKGLVKNMMVQFINEIVPIGLYMIEEKKGKKTVKWANTNFKDLVRSSKKSNEKIIDRNIQDFYKDENELYRLEQAVNDAEKRNQPLIGYDLRFKNGKNVIINTRQIRNIHGEFEARIGAIYDVTENVERWSKKLQQEIGSFTHTYSSMLQSFERSFLFLSKSIGKDLIEGKRINVQKIEKNLKIKVIELEKLVRSEINTNPLKYSKHILNIVKNDLLPNLIPPKEDRLKTQVTVIRRIVELLINYLFENNTDQPETKTEQDFFYLTSEIIKYTNLVSVHHARVEIDSLKLEIELMKEYIATQGFDYGEKKKIDIVDLMNEVIDSLGEYAQDNKVEIRKNYSFNVNTVMKGYRQQLKIALYNLVHNGIKYSFSKSGVLIFPFVRIMIEKTEIFDEIKITIENRGVGIKKEEIESGRIFEFGVRGIHSREGGRLGTGIGLFHSKKVIEHHKGTIELRSISIDKKNIKDYNRPFLTTVEIKLSKYK